MSKITITELPTMPPGYALLIRNLAAAEVEVQVAGRVFFASSMPVTVTSGVSTIGSWYDPFAKPRAVTNFTGTLKVSGNGWVAIGAAISATGADYLPPEPAAIPNPLPVVVSDPVTVTGSVDASVTNFPATQNVSGSVSIDGSVDVNVTNSPLYTAEQLATFGGFVLEDNGPVPDTAVFLPGYNTVTPTIEIGVMTTASLNAQPVLLMLWDNVNNKWRAASCNDNGALKVTLA